VGRDGARGRAERAVAARAWKDLNKSIQAATGWKAKVCRDRGFTSELGEFYIGRRALLCRRPPCSRRRRRRWSRCASSWRRCQGSLP
jgi:hypothetical protein